jgi:hypothetical protein
MYLYLTMQLSHGDQSHNNSVALSSVEAEYMAAAAAAQEAVYLRALLNDIGFTQTKPTVIYEDNTGCIALSKNPTSYKRTKHIDIKYHYIREQVQSKQLVLQYISSNNQLADILTKALGRTQFERLAKLIVNM